MSQSVTASGRTYIRYTETERARRAAAAREGKNRLAGQGHPATSDVEYTTEEWEFMKAIQEFKSRTGKTFPTWREVYRVFVALGYDRAPAGEAGDERSPEFSAAG